MLEQSRKRGAMPGSVALLAGAAFSLCDTRLWVCPWAGGTQEPNATTSQPQRAPMHRRTASLKPQRWEIIKHPRWEIVPETPRRREPGMGNDAALGKGGCSGDEPQGGKKAGPVSWMLSGRDTCGWEKCIPRTEIRNRGF